MNKRRNKSGIVIVLILFAVFSAGVIGTMAWKSRHDGASLYPGRCYPYQGPVMIGTNQAPEPKW